MLYIILTILLGLPLEKAAVANDQPNIVVLFADDLGYGDLGVYGHPTIKTPNLDKMAAQGMKFTNFYSGSPACTASRYSLLTGKYPGRSGFGWVLYPKSERGIHPKEYTVAEGLKAAGYTTACFGKWHLGTTKEEFWPLRNGFDEYFGFPYSNDMIPPKWDDIALLSGKDTVEMNPNQTLLTEGYTAKAVDFIQRNREKPFFLYVPYAMPHLPLHPGKAFAGKSLRGTYGDVVEEIDWSVGKILKVLEQEGLSENTLVIFTSDNGPWIIKNEEGGSSGLLRDGKGSTWEGGMRVPMLAFWDGKIAPGQVNRAPASTLDFHPTFLKLAKSKIPENTIVDGKDISGHLLSNQHPDEAKPFFYYGPKEVHAVRLGDWKLHIKTSSQTGKQYFEEGTPLLFNLNEDPSEQYNLASAFPEKVKELNQILDKHRKSVAETSNYFETNQ